MSRRTGQNGYIEKSGRWYVVRFWKDVDDRKRVHVRERICPISGAGSLKNAKDRKERAKRIIYESGVDSPEYFDKVVRQISSGGVTFREQSEICLKHLQTRKREPIGENYARSIQGAMDKWILPVIGDLRLSDVNSLSVKPLVDKMYSFKLAPRTVNKYIEFVKQVVASLTDVDGEPIHRRTWNAGLMDLPVVKYSEQKRPSLKASPISTFIQESNRQEQALYILLAATGMRISEALA